MAKLEDIAKSLGVSKSTVSKALSGAGDVSDAMRRSIIEAAVEMGYSRLRRHEVPLRLAIFVTNMAYRDPGDFGYDIILGFRKLAEPSGYQVCIVELTQALERSIRYDTYMMEHDFRSGLFLGLSLEDPWLEEFKTCRTPTVLYDNLVTGNPKVTSVGVDNEEGMHLAVAYLKELGHKAIGYLGGGSHSQVYQHRYRSFIRAMWDLGFGLADALAPGGSEPTDSPEESLSLLLEKGCTAIICSHDVLAVKVLDLCREQGIRVPEDLSIIGIDDLPICQTADPPLTTLRQNRSGLGKSAFCALNGQMESVPLSTLLLHAELVKRESCAGPRK